MEERTRLGSLGEELAARLLRRHGAVVLARNVTVSDGEIDIVARIGAVRVAVEVRTRWDEDPLASFDDSKLDRVHRSASQTLPPCHRVDLMAVRIDPGGASIHWLPDL